jgi:hypothetical protein
MSFVSQISQSRSASSRIGDSSIVVTQSFKPSTSAQELSIRITAALLGRAGMKVGDLVDVLHDPERDLWMVMKMDSGLKVTGKDDAPTGLIRYTLKGGHARFTDEKDHLPIRKSSVEDSIEVGDGQIIFKVK